MTVADVVFGWKWTENYGRLEGGFYGYIYLENESPVYLMPAPGLHKHFLMKAIFSLIRNVVIYCGHNQAELIPSEIWFDRMTLQKQ